MLVIRLQRRGRKGHAQFRVIVQEKQLSPKSEKVVAHLGSYDPHTKTADLDKEKAQFYMKNGAQPSNRVAKIFRAEKMTLPKWVVIDETRQGKPKTAKEESDDTPKEEGTEEAETEEKKEEAPAEESKEDKSEDSPEDSSEEKPADDEKADDSADKPEETPKEEKAEEKTEEK